MTAVVEGQPGLLDRIRPRQSPILCQVSYRGFDTVDAPVKLRERICQQHHKFNLSASYHWRRNDTGNTRSQEGGLAPASSCAKKERGQAHLPDCEYSEVSLGHTS